MPWAPMVTTTPRAAVGPAADVRWAPPRSSVRHLGRARRDAGGHCRSSHSMARLPHAGPSGGRVRRPTAQQAGPRTRGRAGTAERRRPRRSRPGRDDRQPPAPSACVVGFSGSVDQIARPARPACPGVSWSRTCRNVTRSRSGSGLRASVGQRANGVPPDQPGRWYTLWSNVIDVRAGSTSPVWSSRQIDAGGSALAHDVVVDRNVSKHPGHRPVGVRPSVVHREREAAAVVDERVAGDLDPVAVDQPEPVHAVALEHVSGDRGPAGDLEARARTLCSARTATGSPSGRRSSRRTRARDRGSAVNLLARPRRRPSG